MPFVRTPISIYLVAGRKSSPATITLLSDRELDTLALGQTDPWLLATNDEDVALTSGELVVHSVLDMDNSEATIMALTMSNDTNTTHVTTTSDHGDDTSVELDEVGDLAGSQIDLDGIIDLDLGIWVSDSSCIMRNKKGDASFAELNASDFAKFVCRLFSRDAVHGEPALCVVNEAEVLTSLLDGDDVLEAGGVGGIGADLAIDLDQALHDNGLDFAAVKRIL